MTIMAPPGSIQYIHFEDAEFTCMACGDWNDFPDAIYWGMELQPLELDSNGLSRDYVEKKHTRIECDHCQSINVFGQDKDRREYVALARTPADLRYLKQKEKA